MHNVLTEELQQGMVLARNLFNDRGDTLLAKGITLTEQYVESLQQRGFRMVYVRDGIADDVDPPELLSPKVRALTQKHLGELFSIGRKVATSVQEGKLQEEEALEQFASAAKPCFVHLYQDVQRIVQEVAGTPVISGIVSLKSHDNYTFEHSMEVAVTAVVLGERLRLRSTELEQLALGCLCHDLGKLTVPRGILNKPGTLTSDEFGLMREHPQASYQIAQRLMTPGDIIARNLVRQHHERQDGHGYPRGLRGTNHLPMGRPAYGQTLILPAAEIAAVADVYSAVSSDRPYRRAMDPPEVAATLRKMAGTHLNREIVSRLLSILPTYPVGTEVVVVSGKLEGYSGIVTDVDPYHVNHPIVRILFDSRGHAVAPIEVDTRKEKGVELAVSPLPRPREVATVRAGRW